MNSRSVVMQIRRLALGRNVPESDSALLELFVHTQDQTAFAALVERHGGMVLGVCRRILPVRQDAEDCMQATFLILARKAASIYQADRLTAWLYGTAYRIAWRHRRASARRDKHESVRRSAPRYCADPLEELTARELLLVLDEEVQRLPEVYRTPLILCALEGLSQEEAAARLGWTMGSLRGRLQRARALLEGRLQRRGLGLSALLSAASAVRVVCSVNGVKIAAEVSPIVRNLVEGGLQAMTLWKWKAALALVVLTGIFGSGLGWLSGQSNSAVAQTPATQGAQKKQPENVAKKKEVNEDGEIDARITRLRRELAQERKQADEDDDAVSFRILGVRARLIELEDDLKDLEANTSPRGTSPEEVRLRSLLHTLEDRYRSAKEKIADTKNTKYLEEVEKEIVVAKKDLQMAIDRSMSEREMMRERRRELRIKILKEEDNLRRLERKRAQMREDSERQREEIQERIRQLSLGSQTPSPDRAIKTLQRKLNAIQRELGEVNRELQQLRSAKK